MVFAASIAIIFAFFYQVDTVGAMPKGGSVARPPINYGAAAAGKISVLFEANRQQKEQVIRYLVKAYEAWLLMFILSTGATVEGSGVGW